MKRENLKDYILHLKNWIPEEILKKTLEELPKQNWTRHAYRDTHTGEAIDRNKEKELDCTYQNYFITYDKELHELVWKALHKYILEEFKEKDPYHDGWQGFTRIRFNRYKDDQIMSKHCDHIHDVFDGTRKGIPVLSILGMLNSDYEGGKFIMFDNYEIELKAGDLLLFPSVFLYPHRVTPVTKGERYSFISWSW
jgi:alkylated DNA repair dioxygenase AlkB